MTDREHADAADAAIRKSTIAYPQWLKNVAAGKYPDVGPPSQFGIAFSELAQIGVVPPPPPPPGNVIFQVDYNTEDFSVWDDVAMLTASKSLVPDPAGSGVRVARLQVGPSATQSYCEPVRLRNNGLALGMTVTVEQELYVDPASVWTTATSWNNLLQTKIQSPDLYGGGLCVQPHTFADGPHFVYRVRDTGSNNDPDAADIDCGPVVTGRWIKFAWTAKWSAGADGFLAITRDGTAFPVYRGPTTTSLGSPSGQDGKGVWRKLTQGLYCGPSLPSPQTVFFKGLKVTA